MISAPGNDPEGRAFLSKSLDDLDTTEVWTLKFWQVMYWRSRMCGVVPGKLGDLKDQICVLGLRTVYGTIMILAWAV